MIINVVDVTTLVLILRGYHKKFPFTTCIPKLGAWWLSNNLHDSRSRDCGIESHQRHHVVYLSKTRYPMLSTGST